MAFPTPTEPQIAALEQAILVVAPLRGYLNADSSVRTADEIETSVREQFNGLRSRLGYAIVIGPAPAGPSLEALDVTVEVSP